MLATPISARPVTLRHPDPYRWALLFRFALVNMAATALATAAWRQGWVDSVLDGDSSRLGMVVVVIFMVGLGLAGRAAVELSGDLDAAHSARPSPTTRIGRYLKGVTTVPPRAGSRLDGPRS